MRTVKFYFKRFSEAQKFFDCISEMCSDATLGRDPNKPVGYIVETKSLVVSIAEQP